CLSKGKAGLPIYFLQIAAYRLSTSHMTEHSLITKSIAFQQLCTLAIRNRYINAYSTLLKRERQSPRQQILSVLYRTRNPWANATLLRKQIAAHLARLIPCYKGSLGIAVEHFFKDTAPLCPKIGSIKRRQYR